MRGRQRRIFKWLLSVSALFFTCNPHNVLQTEPLLLVFWWWHYLLNCSSNDHLLLAWFSRNHSKDFSSTLSHSPGQNPLPHFGLCPLISGKPRTKLWFCVSVLLRNCASPSVCISTILPQSPSHFPQCLPHPWELPLFQNSYKPLCIKHRYRIPRYVLGICCLI